jgi:hypothetical protein
MELEEVDALPRPCAWQEAAALSCGRWCFSPLRLKGAILQSPRPQCGARAPTCHRSSPAEPDAEAVWWWLANMASALLRWCYSAASRLSRCE